MASQYGRHAGATPTSPAAGAPREGERNGAPGCGIVAGVTNHENPDAEKPPDPLLAIDVGNTRVKVGWFSPRSEDCVEQAQSGPLPIAAPRVPEPVAALADDAEALRSGVLFGWLDEHGDRDRPPRVVVASVSGPTEAVVTAALGDWFGAAPRIERLASESLPLVLRVEHPERIGVDRVVAAVAANELRRQESPAIVIDIGTAITVDLLAADGALEGGAILPGPRLAARALAEATDRLPAIDFGDLDASPDAVGRSTEPAIRAGLFWGAVGAVRELIARQSDRLTSAPQVFVTGGAAPAFARLIGGPEVAVRHVPHLTLSGIAIAAGSAER